MDSFAVKFKAAVFISTGAVREATLPGGWDLLSPTAGEELLKRGLFPGIVLILTTGSIGTVENVNRDGFG